MLYRISIYVIKYIYIHQYMITYLIPYMYILYMYIIHTITYVYIQLIFHNMYKLNKINNESLFHLSYLCLATTAAATAHGKCSILVASLPSRERENISHQKGKQKIIFKRAFGWDMLVPWKCLMFKAFGI